MNESHKNFDPAAYAPQAASMIGLTLAPAHTPGVIANLALAARMAALIEAMPIRPEDEAAPVFVAKREPPR